MITKTEMQKKKKVVLQSFLISIALTGGIGTSTFSALLGMSPLGLDASADTYSWQADQAVNSGNLNTNTEYDTVDDVTFDDPESAVVGKWVNLKKVEKVARISKEIQRAKNEGRDQFYIDYLLSLPESKDKNNYDQWIDYQVKNVYVRKDPDTGKNIAAYVGGKTQISIWPMGRANSVSILTGKDGQPNSYKEYKRYSRNRNDYRKVDPKGRVVFAGVAVEPTKTIFTKVEYPNLGKEHKIVLSDDFDKNVDSIKVGYTPDGSTDALNLPDQYYTTPRLQVRTQTVLKKEIQEALAKRVESKTKKAAAKAEIEKVKKEIHARIDQDDTLNHQEKQDQHFEVDKAFAGIDYDIDKKDNAKDVQDVIDDRKKAAEAKHKSNAAVKDRKQEVFAAIDAAAKQKRAEIDSDPDLTNEEKEKIYPDIDKVTEKLKQKFDTVQNADDLEDKIFSHLPGEAYAEVVVKPNQTLDERKDSAKTSIENTGETVKTDLEQRATTAKAKIDLDGGLTPDEKQTQKNAIDNAVKKAKDDLDSKEANDAMKVNAIRAKAEADLKILTDKKKEARRSAARLVNDKLTDIKHNDQLTSEQKAQYDNDLTGDYQDFVHRVDAARTTDEIPSVTAGSDFAKSVENSVKVDADAFEKTKSKAKDDVQKKANKAIADIKEMNNLTDGQKDEAYRQVQVEADRINKSIGEATDAARVEELVKNAEMPIPNNLPIDQLIQVAKNDADADANEAEGEIAANQGLEGDQIAQLKADIESAKKAFQESFDGAPDANELARRKSEKTLANAIETARTNMAQFAEDNLRKKEEALKQAKNSAKDTVQKDANNKRAAIDEMTDLSQNQRDKLKQLITDAENKVDQRIDGVTNFDKQDDDIAKAKQGNDLEDALNKAKGELAGKLLDNKKQARKALIDQKEKDAIATIDKLNSLSTDEKNKAKSDIAAAAKKNRDSISAATDDTDFENKNTDLSGDKGLADIVEQAKNADWNKASQAAAEAEKSKKDAEQAAKAKEKADGEEASAKETNRIAQEKKQSEAEKKRQADEAKSTADTDKKKADGDKAKADNEYQVAKQKADEAEKQSENSENHNENTGGSGDSEHAGGQETGGHDDNKHQDGSDSKPSVEDLKKDASDKKEAADRAGIAANDAAQAAETAAQNAETAKTNADNAANAAKGTAATLTDKEAAAKNADSANTAAQEKAAKDDAKRREALETAKKAAQAAIDKQKADAEKKVKAMLDLAKDTNGTIDSDVQKKATDELKKIDEDYQKAKTGISSAQDSDSVANSKNDFNANGAVDSVKDELNNKKSSIEDQKQAAKDALKKKIADANDSLDKLDGLDEQSKAIVKDKLKADANKAKDDIENRVAGLDKLVDGGKHDTDSLVDIVNNTNFDQDVQDAKNKVKQFADALKKAEDKVKNESNDQQARIDRMDNISSADKEKAKEKVRAAERDALAKVDASTSADDIKAKEADGHSFRMETDNVFADLNNQESLDNQKKELIGLIEQDASLKKDAINGMDNLSQSEKSQAGKSLDKEAERVIKKLDGSKTKDELTQNFQNDQYEKNAAEILEGVGKNDSLYKQKVKGMNAVDADADALKAEIDALDKLSKDDKEKAKADIDSAATKAKDKIDDSSDTDTLIKNGLEATFPAARDRIKENVAQKPSLADQKSEAKAAIDRDAEAKKSSIDGMDNLSTKEKAKAKADLDAAVLKDKAAVDGAKNKDALVVQKSADSYGDNVKNVDDDVKKTPSLDDQKKASKQQIDDDADQHKENINAMDKLAKDEKKKAGQTIDEAADKAKKGIDATDDKDQLNVRNDDTTYSDAVKDISDKIDAIPSLADQKEAAKADVDKVAAEKKAAIDKMKNLTKDQKNKAKAAIDAAAEKNKAAIDTTVNKDKLTDQIDDPTFDDQVQKVDEQMASNGSVDDQKASVAKQMEDALEKAKARIDRDPTLSAEQKASQKAALDQNWSQKKAALMQAEDADVLSFEKEAVMDLFEDVHLSGLSLDEQKDAAKNKVMARVMAMKQVIEKDLNLTHFKKELRLKMLDKVQSDFFAKLEKAESTDDIRGLLMAFEEALSSAQDGHLTALPEAGKREGLANMLTEVILGVMAAMTSVAYFATKKRNEG